jgi:hypothetical protein
MMGSLKIYSFLVVSVVELELKLKNDMGMVGFMVKMQRRKEQF